MTTNRLNMPMWCLGLLLSCLAIACEQSSSDSAVSTDAPASPAKPEGPSIELVLTYGSEKKAWVTEVTNAFNAADNRTAAGNRIYVTATAMGSGETVEEVLSGRRQSHLISPASGAFIKLGNAQSRAASNSDLVGSTDNLVLSPTVIAMWKPMAEALGWPVKPIGWADILTRAADSGGWSTLEHPEWGRFKLGHTHPEFSNSGIQTAFAICYAATGKVNNLSVDDVNKPETAKFMNQIQSAVQHYGSSTGFFNDKMTSGGPGYLSAAVLYENLVIEANQKKDQLAFPMVAIYPKEGTFWTDHPIGIVQRDWVTAEHQEAAKKYIQFLLAKPQQESALKYGFRPADASIPLTSPVSEEFGVDAKQPSTTLEVPSPEVMQACIDLWKREKKKANVVLVFDVSGSMKQDNRLPGAKTGAVELIKMLGDEDTLSVLPFSSESRWALQSMPVSSSRSQMTALINNLIADGGTALYNSIDDAHQYLSGPGAKDGKIAAVVVLTDGEDTAKRMNLDQLIQKLSGDVETNPIRVFTIGYGGEANEKALKRIADITRGKYYKGDQKNIREVFKDIATFF